MGKASRLRVVISSSPEDASLTAQILAHLRALARFRPVDIWTDGDIPAGADVRAAMEEALAAADVALLLVSASYLASGVMHDAEIPRVFERRRSGGLRVIPVLMRSCSWELHPWIGTLKPAGMTPLAALAGDERDRAMAEVARMIGRIAGSDATPTRDTTAPSPRPRYADPASEELSRRIEEARARRAEIFAIGAPTAKIDSEILSLRRQLREGGQLRAGDSLGEGRYLLIDQIGRGGFAVVWVAYDRERRERVAVKVLHSNLADDLTRRERFFRGARAMADLEHPAIVRILASFGDDGGYYYFIMELVTGRDMRRAILDRELREDAILPIILGVGDALSAAHQRGMIHRDVKPANILIDAEGAPRLTDFDLVGAADTTGGTRTGALGTFLFAAPEMLDRPQEAGVRADVYGLGMTAIFGLHGAELPRTVFGPGQAAMVIDRLPCNDAVKGVLEQAVAWDEAHRFEDMAEFCLALRQASTASTQAELIAAEGTSEKSPTRSFTVEVDLSTLKKDWVARIFTHTKSTVSSFLDVLWLDYLRGEVPAYTYRDWWVLDDVARGASLSSTGKTDLRPLASAGITPGVRLKLKLTRKGAQEWASLRRRE
ncbi:serine/threonine-protein kinase [Sorangium sp. So ce542]|uniref:serine/threonine-protein kinase n=1 Tax=Sorangium sp. So ce542 TaxID=3133316 RepID=UPI003F5FE818